MERQVYQRRSFIPKVCIECKKEFQAQRNTAMYCGAGCLQAHRNRRLAGHQETMKMTRATPVVNYPGQQVQKQTEQQINPDNNWYYNQLMKMREEYLHLMHKIELEKERSRFNEALDKIKNDMNEKLENANKLKNEKELQFITGIARQVVPDIFEILFPKTTK